MATNSTTNPTRPRRAPGMDSPPRNISSTTEFKSSSSDKAARKEGILDLIGLLQIPFAGIAMTHQIRNPEQISPITLDIETIEMYKEPLADELVKLAEANPVVGVILDRLALASPFGSLLGLVFAMGAQFAENHGVLPDHLRGINPSLVDRQELANHIAKQAARRAETTANNGNTPSE